MEQDLLSRLPHEVLLRILKHYLDLQDVWNLTRVSKKLNAFGLDIIKKHWRIDLYFEIENKTKALIITQLNVAMMTLNALCHKFIQRIKIYDPYAYPPFLNLSSEHSDEDYSELRLFSPRPPTLAYLQDDHHDVSYHHTFPPTVEPGLDEVIYDQEFILERILYHSKRLHVFLQPEVHLHARIMTGLLPFREKINSLCNTIIKILFQHAINVSSQDRCTSFDKLGTQHGFTRTFAAGISRLVCALKTNFPECTDWIDVVVWKHLQETILLIESQLTVLVTDQQQVIPEKYSENDLRQREKIPVLLVVFRLSAWMDLLGALYVASHLKNEYVIPAIQRLSKVLSKFHLTVLKNNLLKDLIDVWLSFSEAMSHSNLYSVAKEELLK